MVGYEDTPYVVVQRRENGFGTFLLGALVGAGAARLRAPRSGEETRGELRAGVTRLRERAEDTVRNLQDSVTDTIGTVRDEVTDRIEVAREAFDAGRTAARETRTDMERRVEEAKVRVRAGIDAARAPVDENPVTGEIESEYDA
jgi:gas vesicle protein